MPRYKLITSKSAKTISIHQDKIVNWLNYLFMYTNDSVLRVDGWWLSLQMLLCEKVKWKWKEKKMCQPNFYGHYEQFSNELFKHV